MSGTARRQNAPRMGPLQRYLDPVDRFGEAIFGLIMALGVTGAVQLGMEEATSWQLFLSILGCNIAWGIVDGVMYVMLALFERGRAARITMAIRGASDAEAIEAIRRELDPTIRQITSTAERHEIYRTLLDGVRRSEVRPVRVRADDMFGGLTVAILLTLLTVPVALPFAMLDQPHIAARASNAIALAMLFLVGLRWGTLTGGQPWRAGLGMVGVGLLLVAITIALGG